MPNDFVDTFNNLIPSHIMKFILWQDEEDSDVEYQDEEHPLDDEEEEGVLESEDLSEVKNLHSNN